MTSVLVTGAGGFIGGHLVARLREQGVENIRGVDRVPLDEWHQRFDDVDNRSRRPPGPGGLPERLRGRSTSSTTSPPTWAGWASSRTTRRCACCRC